MKKLALISIFLIPFASIRSQIPQYIADSLQNVLEIYQGSNMIPGISAAVHIYNVGTWTGTSGESFENNSLTTDMLMGIGSNTKTFTAVMMLKLAEYDIVSLDDPLYMYLPNFNNIDSAITIKQLLRHNSGVADFWTTNYVNAIFSNPDSIWTPEDVLNFVGPPLFPAGTNVSYSNTNFTLAGMIIEAVTGQEYFTMIRDSILAPLELNNTFLEGFETVNGISAHPWHLGDDVDLIPRTAVTTGAFAAGCIKSNPGDMVKWYDHLFNQGFLSEASMLELTDFINVSGSSVNGVGCEIFRMVYNSKTYYLHNGNIRGYASYTLYDSEDKHSISVLRNDTFINCENIAKALADALDGLITDFSEHRYAKNEKGILIYPNPSNGLVWISTDLPQTKDIIISVFDLTGNMVIKGQILDNKYVDLQMLDSGIYFLKISDDDSEYLDKIVIN